MESNGSEAACVYYACQACTLKFFSREQKFNACPRCGGHVMKTLQEPPWRTRSDGDQARQGTDGSRLEA